MSETPISAVIARTGGHPNLYGGAAREVRARAAVDQSDDSPALKKALAQLDRVLATGRAPKPNVPRGYYLNVTV